MSISGTVHSVLKSDGKTGDPCANSVELAELISDLKTLALELPKMPLFEDLEDVQHDANTVRMWKDHYARIQVIVRKLQTI